MKSTIAFIIDLFTFRLSNKQEQSFIFTFRHHRHRRPTSNWIKSVHWHSICHRMDRCRTAASPIVVAVRITVFPIGNDVWVHCDDWPSNWNWLWCRAVLPSIRSHNAWKWPNRNFVHCKRPAANWSYERPHRNPPTPSMPARTLRPATWWPLQQPFP